jgi:hypothetical protein
MDTADRTAGNAFPSQTRTPNPHSDRVPKTRPDDELTRYFARPSRDPAGRGLDADDELWALAVRRRLAQLPSFQSGALGMRFQPRSMPSLLDRAFGPYATIVVRLDCIAHPSKVPRRIEELEALSVRRLEEALFFGLDRARIKRLHRRARGLVAEALHAYTELCREEQESRSLSPRATELPAALPREPPSEAEPKKQVGSTADRELAWFFAWSEEDLLTHPSSFTLLLWETTGCDAPDPDDLADALHSWRKIRDWLVSIPDSDAGILQVAYQPSEWPAGVARVFGERLAPIAIRLMCHLETWPGPGWARDAILASKTSLLEARILVLGDDDDGVKRLWREATARLALAIHAYAVARGDGPCLGRDL